MRKLKNEMIVFLNNALEKNGLAQGHIKNKNARGLMVEAAKVCVGQREATGKNDGFFVELAQKTVDGAAEGEPWCMAFVQTMIAYAELKTGIISPLAATEHCQTLWAKTQDVQKVKNIPLAGAIVIWKYGNTSNGHTGIVLDCDGNEFSCVEGNASGYMVPVTNEIKNVNRNGNGVFYTRRSKFGSGDMKVLGFIKPF